MTIIGFVKTEDTEWLDYNKTPAKRFYIEIPFWVGRAFRLGEHSKVLVTIPEKHKSIRDLYKRCSENRRKYFKENWSKKIRKMRKINHNYLEIERVIIPKNSLWHSDNNPYPSCFKVEEMIG